MANAEGLHRSRVRPPHGLAFQDGAPGTDLLLPGARFQCQFERPGTYDYKCAIHPYMTGRVVVRAP